MRRIASLISKGNFDSGSVNSDKFNDFFEKFKVSFTNELKKVKATNLQFSKGHFYLSGFFTVGEQVMYFSLSDVRWFNNYNWNGQPEMLIRTAKHDKDYTGGGNNFVAIEPNMSKKIAQIAGQPEAFKKANSTKLSNDEIAEKLVKTLKKDGEATRYVSSSRQASYIAWRVADKLGIKNMSLQQWKLGRYLTKVVGERDGYNVHYSADSKTLSLDYSDPNDPNKFDIDEIVKEGIRHQDSNQTLSLLKTQQIKLISWGAQNFATPIKNVFRFNVNGHHHKGYVYIVVNGADLFDVYLTTFTNKKVDKLEGLFFDELVNRIDERIEKIPEYFE